MAESRPDPGEVVFSSPCLYLGELRVRDRVRRKKRWSGTQLKDRVQPLLQWFLRDAPAPFALLPFHLISGLAWLFYRLPGSSLRRACEDISVLAARAGHAHRPAELHARFRRNLVAAARCYSVLYREGADAAARRVDLSGVDRTVVERLLREHGAFMLFAPHNLASAFAGLGLSRMLPLVLIMRNATTIRRTRLALETFERMGTSILMVRGGSPFELARGMYTALAAGKVLAATVDNVDPGSGATARIFGVDVEFGDWSARIACRRRVPVVPSWYHSSPEGARVRFGEPLVTDDSAAILQHCVRFFELCILEDPASWAYLADRKWWGVLRQAARSGPPLRTPAGTAA